MSVRILDALDVLNHSFERLESALAEQERKSLLRQQQDLFATQEAAAPQFNNHTGDSGNVVALDPALLEGKLDSAIGKIEALLQEGRA